MEKNNVSYMDHLEEVDLNDSFDAIWQAHMQQLQPCGTCGRTFFPERLVIHERSCKSKTPKTADPQMNRRPRLGPISPKAEKPVPEKPVRDIPVQYYLAK
ncbi:zinc finger protein 474 [Eurytemora carolleeae]|uniref:zinc finger protein 474 n=1 Tax=Eurytemora carolleeae TaxID=1294199 RepID=UPI000C79004A|nr:zinc finger protein 474 [Eurytemora carolleeae]|eukprot:XP_023345131.1 zinc finger protein 474-like [Eurytemora affinis]